MRARIAVLVDEYPSPTETFVRNEVHELARTGHRVLVLAGVTRDDGDTGGATVARIGAGGAAARLRALAWLLARHPLRSARDVLARGRWRRQEPVRPLRELASTARLVHVGGWDALHAHFAAGAALDALRLGRLLGLPYSLTAHAYDIYALPRNLEEKLRAARFVTTGCDYNVRHLRELVPDVAGRIHELVMGVDVERFKRTQPYPGGRTVVAVGRLVEKKGFADLVRAAAALDGAEALARVVIAGEGPLRAELGQLVADLGLDGLVELPGALSHEQVRELLERADVLAMPAVIAASGDRDSMPVVVKEALSMEVPVVTSDAVGLPELVEPGWGRLHPAGDPAALAAALKVVLALPPDERAAMGARGRAHVTAHCNVQEETARLAALIASQ